MTSYSIYIHVPFCRSRCSYCDFNTYAGISHLIPTYCQALCQEMKSLCQASGTRLPVHTVYFGGGTPSLLPTAELNSILTTLADCFALQASAEISMEGNPTNLSLAYLKDIFTLGVNRLSLGMQSSHPEELGLLGRRHRYDDIVQAVNIARKAGFDNLNLDLIYGIPMQTIEKWTNSLQNVIDFNPTHISLYALTLEPKTVLQDWIDQGSVAKPDPDMAADMYDKAAEMLAMAGFVHYEISNWALPMPDNDIWSCRHNLQYWRNLPYLGFGAGAHGYAGNFRTANVLRPMQYINRINRGGVYVFPNTPATARSRAINKISEMSETMIMGLRLIEEGVSEAVFRERFGVGLREVYGPQIDHLIKLDLLEWVQHGVERLRLTKRGHLLGNQVFIEFV